MRTVTIELNEEELSFVLDVLEGEGLNDARTQGLAIAILERLGDTVTEDITREDEGGAVE